MTFMERIPNLTKREFRRKLRDLEMTQRRFAEWTQVDVMTVNRWATGVNPIPHWVRLLLDLRAQQKKRS